MRSIDNRLHQKHLRAMRKIVPVCKSKPMIGNGIKLDDGNIFHPPRLIIQWGKKKIKSLITIVEDLEIFEKGLESQIHLDRKVLQENLFSLYTKCRGDYMCGHGIYEWMTPRENHDLLFSVIRANATGQIKDMAERIQRHLHVAINHDREVLMVFCVKNKTCFDKVCMLLGASKWKFGELQSVFIKQG